MKANYSSNTISIIASSKQSNNIQFEWIDILRGLAALGVVLFHSRVDLWVGWNVIRENSESFSDFEKIIAWLSLPLPFLGSGVMLFFLLSGFCIHFPAAINNKVELIPYFTRRLLRIIPPYLAAVILSLLVEMIRNYFFGEPISKVDTVFRTTIMLQNYPPNPSQLISNPSLWSLPVEVELYLVYPSLLWLSTKAGKGIVLLTVTTVSLVALILTVTSISWMKGSFTSYWIIWCSGALLAFMVRNEKIPSWTKWHFLLMLFVFSVAILITIAKINYIFSFYFWSAGFFLLLLKCLQLPSPSSLFPFFIINPLLWLGKISFSLYLIHLPLFKLVGSIWENEHGGKPSNLLISFACSILAVFIAKFFYKYVEVPSHDLARKLGKRRQVEIKELALR